MHWRYQVEKTQAIPLRGTTLGGSQEVLVTKHEMEKEDAGKMVDHPPENSDVRSELGLKNVVGPIEAKRSTFKK